jgi:hypothetical protein
MVSVGGGGLVAAWCEQRLGAGPIAVLFRAGHLSVVLGLRLADGLEVVVKARPPSIRVYGCVAVQQALARVGFPCPGPLAGPEPLEGSLVTAEQFVGGGERLAVGADSAERFAGLLAELVALAPPVSAVPSLAPSPPWVGFDHDAPGLWPTADDRDEDLNAHPGPEWLDETAVRVRGRLAELQLPQVVGHGDWESQNIRWRGRRPWVVHDWDSVVAQPEAAIAGQAAAVWPPRPVAQARRPASGRPSGSSPPTSGPAAGCGPPPSGSCVGLPGCGCVPSTPRRTPSAAAGRSWTGSSARWPSGHATLASDRAGLRVWG